MYVLILDMDNAAKGIAPSSGGPTCLPRDMILIQTLKLTQLLIPTLPGWREQIPKKEKKREIYAFVSLFLPFPVKSSWSLLEQIPVRKFSTRPSMQEDT